MNVLAIIEAGAARMPLMSSRMTFSYKRIFPVIWFGFLAVFFGIALVKGLTADPISNLPFLVVPVVMAILGYQIMKKWRSIWSMKCSISVTRSLSATAAKKNALRSPTSRM